MYSWTEWLPTSSLLSSQGSLAGVDVLQAMLLLADWGKMGYEGAFSRVTGFVLASGLFDLAAVRRSYANEALQLTEAEVAELSPLSRVGEIAEVCNEHKCQVSIRRGTQWIMWRLPPDIDDGRSGYLAGYLPLSFQMLAPSTSISLHQYHALCRWWSRLRRMTQWNSGGSPWRLPQD